MPQSPLDKRLGHYITSSTAGESFSCFIPPELPPEPPLRLDSLMVLMERTNQALGRLDGLSALLPNIHLLIYTYIRKEAVLSSQIEGTQSSLSDLLMYEGKAKPGVPLFDVIEVSNYVAALQHGLDRLKNGFPLSLRLIKEMHQILLSEGRGSTKQPGEFRRSQNWIGGTRPGNAKFVPPPSDELMRLMGSLELFLHNQSTGLPTLIKAALAHVQFETIHPFLDGNGRLGRLLITLLLCEGKVLQEPILYLSLYFKTHRTAYYDHLQSVRLNGDWESWLEFFLNGVLETATQATKAARRILDLFDLDQQTISQSKKNKTSLSQLAIGSMLKVYKVIQEKPIVSVSDVSKSTQMTYPTAKKALTGLAKLGIVREIPGVQRGKIYAYVQYLSILSEDTEPI